MSTSNLGGFLRRLTRGMAAETLRGLSDRQLLERLLTGRDEAAFEAIVRRHGPMVYRVCWRVLRQDQDTEDAFQATFLVLGQKIRSLRKLDSLASWLHGVAHRVALKALTQAATCRDRERQTKSIVTAPPEDVTWRELCQVLDAELARLPQQWRLPLILCYLEGLTQDEAADHLGWTKITLRRRLEEGRQALGRRLQRRGLALPAALSGVLLSDCIGSAALPLRLACSTVEAVAGIASQQVALLSSVSSKAAALTKGVLRTMLYTKLKIAAVIVAIAGSVIGGTVVGTELFTRRSVAAERTEATNRGVESSEVEQAKTPTRDAEPTRFVVLSSITQPFNGLAEARLDDRRSNEKIRLRASEGSDVFRILDKQSQTVMEGKVVRILDREVIFESKDKLYLIRVGMNLEEALRQPISPERRKELEEQRKKENEARERERDVPVQPKKVTTFYQPVLGDGSPGKLVPFTIEFSSGTSDKVMKEIISRFSNNDSRKLEEILGRLERIEKRLSESEKK